MLNTLVVVLVIIVELLYWGEPWKSEGVVPLIWGLVQFIAIIMLAVLSIVLIPLSIWNLIKKQYKIGALGLIIGLCGLFTGGFGVNYGSSSTTSGLFRQIEACVSKGSPGYFYPLTSLQWKQSE